MEYAASLMIFTAEDRDTGDLSVGDWRGNEDRGKEMVERRKGLSVYGVPGLCLPLVGESLFLTTVTQQLWHQALPPPHFIDGKVEAPVRIE